MMGLIALCLVNGALEHYRSGTDHHGAAARRLAGARRLRGARCRCSSLASPSSTAVRLVAGPRMSGVAIAALGFAAMLLLIAVRMPVGLSMLVVGAVGYVYLSAGRRSSPT